MKTISIIYELCQLAVPEFEQIHAIRIDYELEPVLLTLPGRTMPAALNCTPSICFIKDGGSLLLGE